jgi:hypothetical protein
MWTKVEDNRYTYTLNHKLNDENISCTIYNSDNKQETLGVQIMDNDNVKFESTTPIQGKIVINYSSSNSDRLSNTATIDSRYVFDTMTDVDSYFEATKNALVYGLIISVGLKGSEKIYKWTGEANPTTYDNTNFIEQTYFIKGQRGDVGSKPSHKWNNTILHFENPDGSFDEGINLKGETGSVGTQLNVTGSWSNLVEYTVTADSIDVVAYNGKTYCCLKTNTGKQPDLEVNKEYWGLLIDGVLETQSDWTLDTTSKYPILKLKTPDGKLYNVAKNGDDNDCIVFGDLTRSTHIDSLTDVKLGKIEQDNDLSFDINSDFSESKSTTSTTFEIVPTIKGFVTAISLNLSDVQTNTQVYFSIKDKESSSIIYEDNINLTDFTNGVDSNAYNVINGQQVIPLHKIFSLTLAKVHEITFTFNKTTTIKGSTINSIFMPTYRLTVKGMSLESLATQEWALDSFGQNVIDSLSPHGMKDINNCEISFDESTRTFSVKPKNGVTSFTYYLMGTRQEITLEKTIQIPDTTGVYYITFDNTGTLSYSSSYSTDDFSKLPLLFIRWNDVTKKAESLSDIRIGDLWLDPQTRSYIINTTGATYKDGFQITSTLNGDGSSDSQAQIALTNGSFKIAERTFLFSNSSTPTNLFDNIMSPMLNVKLL